MNKVGSFEEYSKAACKQFAAFDEARRMQLVNSVDHLEIRRVLDVGCGGGQMLLPFLEGTGAICVGADAADDLGKVTNSLPGRENFAGRLDFVTARGEQLPFEGDSFDVVICSLAIPYMNNRRTIGEIGRVLRPNGVFFLKTHALPLYLAMIQSGLQTRDLKRAAYAIICVMLGILHWFTGIRLERGFWKGKEVFKPGVSSNECAPE